jgi:hypothetical protein
MRSRFPSAYKARNGVAFNVYRQSSHTRFRRSSELSNEAASSSKG